MMYWRSRITRRLKTYKPVETIIHPDEVKGDFEEVDAEEAAIDTVKHVVFSYAARNSVFHSKSAQLQDEGNWVQLVQPISTDLAELPEFLPDD